MVVTCRTLRKFHAENKRYDAIVASLKVLQLIAHASKNYITSERVIVNGDWSL